MVGILWAVIAILVVLWVIGFLVAHITGFFIHILLVLAVVVLVYNLIMSGRARRPL